MALALVNKMTYFTLEKKQSNSYIHLDIFSYFYLKQVYKICYNLTE